MYVILCIIHVMFDTGLIYVYSFSEVLSLEILEAEAACGFTGDNWSNRRCVVFVYIVELHIMVRSFSLLLEHFT